MKVWRIPSSITFGVLMSILSCGHVVTGFAYAPNFVTKIISDSTGIEPVGLLDVNKESTQKKDETAIEATEAVMTRFPPEPNGYLHLGHAKAVSFNFAVARMFGGKCNMRMDDTNPSKEDKEYVDSILEDVRWIQSGMPAFIGAPQDTVDKYDQGPWNGCVRKTSSYFDIIYESAIALIKSGDAYVESLSAEEMREYRGTLTEPGKNSPYRDRSVEENLEMFQKMRNGEYEEGSHILRAKIDMASPNINMRDPALYRIKHESHPETGDKWCIYPMYDFSHPISDALEGITHSLCTLEFEDHRPLYDWTIEKLLPTGLIQANPRQIEFSRLNLQYTVLSKRKLIQLVQENHVSGWDDPRMPTLSGVRRRGFPPEALRLFCERVGISKSDSNIDFGEMENCVREVLDSSSSRAFAVLDPLKVTITNWQGSTLEDFDVPRHPKFLERGDRVVPFGKNIYIERTDFFDINGPEGKSAGGTAPKGFKRLLEGGDVRLKYAYVITCDEVVRDPETNEPVELKCTLNPETRAGATPEGMRRVKGIIQWVEAKTAVTAKVNLYDRLFKTEEPGKDTGNFLDDINPDSLKVLKNAVMEPSVAMDALKLLAEIRSNEEEKIYHSSLSFQFERNGYFALDSESTGMDNLVFNRVSTLRDTWSLQKQASENKSRSRGGNNNSQNREKANGAVIEDVRRVAIRAGTIVEVEPHPDAGNLIVCKVDCGDDDNELRTVVAGLAGKVDLNDIVGEKVACVTNLKPAKMRGIESTAMLLAASNGQDENEKIELLSIPGNVPNGELISFEGKEPSEPDGMMKSKGALKAFERVKICLKTNDSAEATYFEDGKEYRMMTSAGPVTTKTLNEAVIQ